MILRFQHILCNTVFPNRFERMDKDGNIEMIRLVQGTEQVLEEKQDKKARSKDFRTGYANIREGDQVFYQVEITDKAILNYLKKTPYWGKQIIEHDPIEVSKKESEVAKAEIAILAEISTISDNTELLAIGYRIYGQEALDFGKQGNYEGLRVKIFQKAMEAPELLKEILEDKGKSDYALVALAFAKDIVVEGNAGNSVNWGDDGQAKIIAVSLGERPMDALVGFFATAEGREIRQMIGLKIEGNVKKVATKPNFTKKAAETKTEKPADEAAE